METMKEFVRAILYTPFFLSAARHWLRARVLYVSETPLRGPSLYSRIDSRSPQDSYQPCILSWIICVDQSAKDNSRDKRSSCFWSGEGQTRIVHLSCAKATRRGREGRNWKSFKALEIRIRAENLGLSKSRGGGSWIDNLIDSWFCNRPFFASLNNYTIDDNEKKKICIVYPRCKLLQ